jgi:hypothetical protein
MADSNQNIVSKDRRYFPAQERELPMDEEDIDNIFVTAVIMAFRDRGFLIRRDFLPGEYRELRHIFLRLVEERNARLKHQKHTNQYK